MGSLRRTAPGKIQNRTSGGMRGYEVFDPKYRTEVVKVDWDGGGKNNPKKDPTRCPTILKILPFIRDYDDDGVKCKPHFEAYRHGHALEEFNPWYFKAAIGTFGIGDDKRTSVLCDLSVDRPEDTLIGIMIRRWRNVIKKKKNGQIERIKIRGKNYNPLDVDPLFGGEGVQYSNVAFPNLKRIVKYFASVLPLYTRGKLTITKDRNIRGANQGDAQQIVELSVSAGEAIEKALMLPKNDKAGIDTSDFDWDNQFLHGDVTDLKTGKWLVLYNPKYHDIGSVIGKPGPSVANDADDDDEVDFDPDTDAEDDSDGFSSYEALFLDKVRVPVKETKWTGLSHEKFIGGLDESILLQNYRPIYDPFWLPEQHEMALLLAKAFRARPELLYFGFADTPEFWTDDVNAVLNARTAVAMPGNTLDAEDDDSSDLDDDTIGDDDDELFGGDDDDEEDARPVSTKPKGNTKTPYGQATKNFGSHVDAFDESEIGETGSEDADSFLTEMEGTPSAPAKKTAGKKPTATPPGTKKKKRPRPDTAAS